jgi:hypothetical protein
MADEPEKPSSPQKEAPDGQEPMAGDGMEQDPPLRRSTRSRKAPVWFDEVVTIATASTGTPTSIREALEFDRAKWGEAIADEFRSLITNGTWEAAMLPSGRRAISTKWVFKLKESAEGSLRHKARLVIRGFEQRSGIDYDETFAPVAKFVTIRVLLAVAAAKDWDIHQMDVKTAFMNPRLKEEVYMAFPEGYSEFCPNPRDTSDGVLRLLKTVNGLKQAPKAWYEEIHGFFVACGLNRSNEDHNMYLSTKLIIIIYVDDLLLFSRNIGDIMKMKSALSGRFEMSDLGEIRQFLGLQIERNREKRQLFLHQTPYLRDIISRAGMATCNGVQTPMEANSHLCPYENEADITETTEYQSTVGSVMYAMLGTRPDLAYSISTLGKFCSAPIMSHHSALKKVIRYIKQTLNVGILYDGSSIDPEGFPELVCYTDSDWAGDRSDRRSTGGYVFLLLGGAVSWKSKKQGVVATSTAEAEYVALSEAVKESIWINRLLREIKTRTVEKYEFDEISYHNEETRAQWEPNLLLAPKSTIPAQIIYADNQSCIRISENPRDHARTKHIDIRYHFVRHAVYNGLVIVKHVPTTEMTADILTKSLPRDSHWKHLKGMGLRENPFLQSSDSRT